MQSVPQRLKPLDSADFCGTAKAVPLSKAVKAKKKPKQSPLRDDFPLIA